MASEETVALVLAGGGARGAYEIGALSVLLPELDGRGQRPSLVIGTSVGALNAAFIGATAHRPVGEVVADGLEIWGNIHYRDVLTPLLGVREARRIGAYLGEVLGLPVNAASLLDPAPLPDTLERTIDFGDLRRNAAAGRVHAAVVATSAATSRTVVFHTTAPSPEADETRGIDYVRAELGVEHVMASAAIPVAFPAVSVATPKRAAGWYFDGGTRLNAPIKPALSLGADRVIVIGVNSVAARAPTGDARPPDIADGAGQLLQAVLVDPLVNDVNSLARGNREAGRRTDPLHLRRPADPRRRRPPGRRHVQRALPRAPRGLVRSRDVTLLGRARVRRPRRRPRRAAQLPLLRRRVHARARRPRPRRRRALARRAPRRRASGRSPRRWRRSQSPSGAADVRERHALDAHELVARALAAHDRHPRPRHPGPLGDQLAQRRVRLAVDRSRRDAHAQHPVALVDDRVALGAGLQADREVGVGQAASLGRAGPLSERRPIGRFSCLRVVGDVWIGDDAIERR